MFCYIPIVNILFPLCVLLYSYCKYFIPCDYAKKHNGNVVADRTHNGKLMLPIIVVSMLLGITMYFPLWVVFYNGNSV